MSEELPLDPSQVSPPQEVQGAQPPQEDSPVHIEVAHSATESAGAPQAGVSDKQVGPNYIKNKDKAEVMARAQDNAYAENDKSDGLRYTKPEYAAEQAGNDFDLGVALAKEKRSGISTPEEARKFASANRRVFLKYSHAIAENYKKYGDKLSPSLQALELVHGLAGDVGYNNFATSSRLGRDEIMVELDELAGGAILVTSGRSSDKPKEQWRLPMFGEGKYTFAQITGDPEGEFSSIETIKTRSLSDEDTAKLGELLELAVQHRKQVEKRRRETDDGQDDDDNVSTGEIRSRARAAGLGVEEAREAAEMYPGDFM